MHPAFSIIFFSTASGAGFGLLALLGLGVPLGLLPQSPGFGLAGLAVAAILAGGGLASSVFHLGRPERAWRAFSQWRSSWLSREGVLSLLTALAATIFGVGWVFFDATGRWSGLFGIAAAGLAAATVYCTSMIYASLKPVHQWRHSTVIPAYLMLALGSGLLLLDFLARFWIARAWPLALAALITSLLGWWIKERYWTALETSAAPSTVESATGLGTRGKVRLFEPPHSGSNYLLKEMGFVVARKHAIRLRGIARLAGFIVPAALSAIALAGGIVGIIAAALAVLSAGLGLVVERWLFFAQARHTVTLYYGADAA